MEVSYVIKSIASYSNAIAGFILFRALKASAEDILKLSLIALCIEISAGIFSSVFDLKLVEILVPRASSEIGYRGVSGLSAEPARQGLTLALLLIILRDHKFYKFISVLTLLYLVFFNKSATGLCFFLVVVLFNMNLSKRVSFLLVMLILSILFGSLTSFNVDNRAIDVLTGILTSNDILQTLSFLGGFRVTLLLASFMSFDVLGVGSGNWTVGLLSTISEYSILQELAHTSVLRVVETLGVRPMSFFGSLTLEYGFIGLLAAFLLVKYIITLRPLLNSRLIPVWMSLFLLGNVGSPIPFIIFYYFTKRYFNDQ